MKSICVFCGSSSGVDPVYREAAQTVGRTLAERGITLVYGAGNIGMMGHVADAALDAGGRVIGVIPEHLTRWEVGHRGLSEIYVVSSMHERKALMADLSDAVLTLPGGLGTLDELFETLTWTQLRIHDKAVGLLNIAGFFDPLLAMLDHMLEAGFLNTEHRHLVRVSSDLTELLEMLENFTPPGIPKWWERPTR